MDLLPLPILITLIPIRDTTRAWGWRGARPDLRWVLGPAEPGATATGATVISTLTTIITLTGTTLTTSIVATLTAARQAGVSGNTIRNIAAMHLMGIAEQPASSVDVARAVQVVLAVSEDRAALAALENPAAQVALGNRVALDQQDVPAAQRVPDRRRVRAERIASEIAMFPAKVRTAT